jgi:hypothetical protein
VTTPCTEQGGWSASHFRQSFRYSLVEPQAKSGSIDMLVNPVLPAGCPLE